MAELSGVRMTDAETTTVRTPWVRVVGAAVAIGVAVGVVFVGFEWSVNHGTNWIWNTVFASDEHRWVVLVLAPALSVVFSVLMRLLRQQRYGPVHTSLLSSEAELPTTATLVDVGMALVVGLASLLAGASLGPEAALVTASMSIGAWFAGRGRLTDQAATLVLASAGALLVVFVGSLLALFIPVLMLVRRTKRLRLPPLVPIVVAGVVAYGTLLAIRGKAEGFGDVPIGTQIHPRDYLVAFVVGLVVAAIGRILHWFTVATAPVVAGVARRLPWLATAAVVGFVLGLLYLLGGETVQFSGNVGSQQLLDRASSYSAAAVAGLVVVKLLATGWSLAMGYRGGTVFPSVYTGVAVGLVAVKLVSDLSGGGVVLGGVAGILSALINPFVALIFVIALIPAKLIGVAILGAAGAAIGNAAMDKVVPRRPEP